MRHATTQRLHIAQANDWKDAVIALLEPRSPYRPWHYRSTEARKGDAVAFVLNTDPASILTEVAHVEADGNLQSAVFDRPLHRPNLMDLTTLATTVDLEMGIASEWHFDGDDATRLELALDECRFLSAAESRFGHSSGAAARTLLRFWGRCDGCEQLIDLTRPDGRDRIFVHTVDPYRRPDDAASRGMRYDAKDWPAVTCRSCRDRMDIDGFATFMEFKFALHPSCSECGAKRTCKIFYGMPAESWNIPPWSHAGGCCLSSEEWSCGVCYHEW
jgi:hypothetical protein